MSDETPPAQEPSFCLSHDELAAFVQGGATAGIERHVDTCAECRRLVSALALAETTRPTNTSEPEEERETQTEFGRFTLTRLLGQGAMGRVWAAKDPQLNREVAIKVMAHSARQLGTNGKERMRREAHAMARLNHPNVVAIYEFGIVDEQVFCAMEIVEGTSWRKWLETPRPWQQILETALLAARGIRATHKAGLLHRDIKPDNILIADDGRVLLGDFGLAKLIATPTLASSGENAALTQSLDLNEDLETLTCTGELLGTPAYMSPESVAVDAVDERSDQYSFCVSLYEALTGKRPFQGQTLQALLVAMGDGPTWPRDVKGVPSELRRVILRGLCFKPENRFDSMDALIGALEEAGGAKRRRRRRLAVFLTLLLIAGTSAAVMLTRRPSNSLDSVSTTARTQINKAWNDVHRAAVKKAIFALEIDDAEKEFSTIEKLFDKYSLAWLHARIDAWKATHVRNEQSADLLERRLACYDRLAIGVGALVRLFEEIENKREFDQAMTASLNLQSLRDCADPLMVGSPDAAKDDPRVIALEQRLAEIKLLAINRSSEEARAAALQLAADTGALDVPALRARALYELARFQSEGPDPDTATETYWRVIRNAADARDHALVAQSYFHLISLLGLKLDRKAEALALEPVARAAIAQSGDTPGYRGMLDSILGDIYLNSNALEDAERHIRSALEAFSVATGTNNVRQMSLLNDLAGVLSIKGQPAEAAKLLSRAIELSRTVKGGVPVNEAVLLQKLSIFERQSGDPRSAERRAAQAIDIFSEQLGPEHIRTLQARSLRASCLAESGEVEAAEAEMREVSKGLAVTLPKGSRELVISAILHAELLEQLGKIDEARSMAQRAAADIKLLDTEASPDRAESQRVLALVLAHSSPRKALSTYGEALKLRLELPEYDPKGTYVIIQEMSRLALRVGKPSMALSWFGKFPGSEVALAALHDELLEATSPRR